MKIYVPTETNLYKKVFPIKRIGFYKQKGQEYSELSATYTEYQPAVKKVVPVELRLCRFKCHL